MISTSFISSSPHYKNVNWSVQFQVSSVGQYCLVWTKTQHKFLLFPDKKKMCFFLIIHHNDKIFPERNKSDIVLQSNKGKHRCGSSALPCLQNKTIAYFKKLLNLGDINSFVTYIHQFPHCNDIVSWRRKLFLEYLGFGLVKPFIEKMSTTFVGLTCPILHVTATCSITPASADYREEKTINPNWERKVSSEHFWLKGISHLPENLLHWMYNKDWNFCVWL